MLLVLIIEKKSIGAEAAFSILVSWMRNKKEGLGPECDEIA
jgi:hypothetical protein